MSYVGRCAAISQVMSTLAELAKSQIGRSNCIKCVVAEDGIHSDMFQCSAHLLRNLDIEHPVYNVINSVVQSHHTAHGNCCKTLLVMAGLWYQEMEQLVELGLSIGEISTVFEKGLEASVDHLLHSSAVQLLNDDFSLTSGEDVSYGCSASFEGYREDISSRPENEVSAVPSNSFECDKKFGSHMVDRQSLAEDEDVGWFFQGESRDPSSLDSFDREKNIFTEDRNSNFAVDCKHLPSQDCKLLRDSEYLTEKFSNTRLCSDPTDASLLQCLEIEDEIEDEFEDCFSDSIFGLRESETRLAINDSCQASLTLNHDERKSSNDISDQNSTNLVLLNEGLNSEMFHKKVDSNSKLTQEFSSQCGNARNSTLCSVACHELSKDKTEDLLDFENTVKHQIVVDKTEDFGCENTAKFQLGHSDLGEKDILPTSNTISEEAKHACSKCVLTTNSPDCHCANDTCVLVEPDCLIRAQDIASKALNCPPTSAKGQPFLTSSFNFSNRYSRHSLAISSPEDSEQHHAAESKQNSDHELQHQFTSSQNGLGLCVNSSAGDHVKTFDCKSLIASNNNSCRSDDDCGILITVETNKCEKRVGSGAAMGSSNIQTSDSYGLLNMHSRFNHETAFYDVIQDCEENTFCQDGMYKTVFEQRLAMLGSKLSHGADDMMKLVVKMAYQQLKDNGSTRCKQLSVI